MSGRVPAGAWRTGSSRKGLVHHAPAVGGDPSVNPADFRITTFVSGLNYPHGMMTLSDGSLLVGVSNPVGGASYLNSSGELFRFTDTNGDGVADNSAGQVLYEKLPGEVTALEAPKVPHIGWNRVAMRRASGLTRGLGDATAFYHVHSFVCRASEEDLSFIHI